MAKKKAKAASRVGVRSLTRLADKRAKGREKPGQGTDPLDLAREELRLLQERSGTGVATSEGMTPPPWIPNYRTPARNEKPPDPMVLKLHAKLREMEGPFKYNKARNFLPVLERKVAELKGQGAFAEASKLAVEFMRTEEAAGLSENEFRKYAPETLLSWKSRIGWINSKRRELGKENLEGKTPAEKQHKADAVWANDTGTNPMPAVLRAKEARRIASVDVRDSDGRNLPGQMLLGNKWLGVPADADFKKDILAEDRGHSLAEGTASWYNPYLGTKGTISAKDMNRYEALDEHHGKEWFDGTGSYWEPPMSPQRADFDKHNDRERMIETRRQISAMPAVPPTSFEKGGADATWAAKVRHLTPDKESTIQKRKAGGDVLPKLRRENVALVAALHKGPEHLKKILQSEEVSPRVREIVDILLSGEGL